MHTHPQGLDLPQGREAGSTASGEGVWVLGLISGSAAEAAGIQQGDQLLELDGQQLAGQSPFAVASLLQGQEQQEGLGLENPAVQVKASAACRVLLLLLLCLCNSRDGSHLHLSSSSALVTSHFCSEALAFQRHDKSPLPPSLSPNPPPSGQDQVRKFDGSVQQVSLQRPVRVVQSPVDARLEGGSGGERLGVIKLSSFNARAQVGGSKPSSLGPEPQLGHGVVRCAAQHATAGICCSLSS